VPYRGVPGELSKPFAVEYISDQTEITMGIHGLAIGGHNSRAFLTPMLQRIQPEITVLRRFRVSNNPNYRTLFS
jgi:hypothetical protein